MIKWILNKDGIKYLFHSLDKGYIRKKIFYKKQMRFIIKIIIEESCNECPCEYLSRLVIKDNTLSNYTGLLKVIHPPYPVRHERHPQMKTYSKVVIENNNTFHFLSTLFNNHKTKIYYDKILNNHYFKRKYDYIMFKY